jgi:uridine kinase
VQSSDPRALFETILETRRRLGRTTIVGISGIDCAGKSTLAARLADELGDDAVVIRGDYFNKPHSDRSDFPADDPDYGFAYEELVRDLLVPAGSGAAVKARLRIKDWERDEWSEADFSIPSGAIVLVEGVFLFTAAGRPLFDLAIWVEISFEEALERALLRDAEDMGGQHRVRERYAARYFPGQRAHLERDRPRDLADLVVSQSSEQEAEERVTD